MKISHDVQFVPVGAVNTFNVVKGGVQRGTVNRNGGRAYFTPASTRESSGHFLREIADFVDNLESGVSVAAATPAPEPEDDVCSECGQLI